MNRDQLSSLLELLGVAAVLVAAFATDWRLGVAVVGVCLIVVGYLSVGGEA